MQGHTAYGILSVVEKLPLKIESLDVWARGPNTPSTLVVGTSEGVLLVYDIVPSSDARQPPQVNMREPLKTFAKNKPIMQLAVVEKYNMLISLSDSYISIHDLTSFALRTQIAKSKGCHLFTVDTTKPALTMCVAVKKRLSIYQYDGADWTEIRELPLADQARTVTWCGNSLFVGFKSNYYMVHVQTGTTTELFSTGRNQSPVACLLPNEQVLLNKDDISIFLGFDGKTTRKFGLSWTEPPICLGHHYPYVLAVLPKTIEVRTTFGTQTLVQQVQLKTGAKSIVVKNNDIYIAAANQIWKMLPVPIIDQVEQLVKERKYEEALILCENLAVEDESQRMIKTLHAFSLFANGQFPRAMEYYLELDLDPLQVIGLYPNLLPKHLRDKFNYPIEPPQLAGAALAQAMQALINYLTQIRPSVVPNASARNDADYTLTADLAQIIDTSLLKAYIKTNEQLVMPLVSLTNNNCHVLECEKVLASYGKYVELVTLFRTKGMHRQALQLLVSLGQNSPQPPPRPPPTGKVLGPKETIKYLKLLPAKELPLILEFSQWPLQVAPEEAFEIFTEDRSPPLPANEVLAHVKTFAPILTVHLLEYLIHDQKEASPEINNELVFYYLDRILSIRPQPPPPSAPRLTAGMEPGVLGETRSKLIKFLLSTTIYNPEKMLSRFPLNDLLEERAILLSRIGQHEQALIIYAHKLHDDKMAEDYCARHYNPDVESSRDVYLALLKVYLRPAADGTVRVAPALALLNKHFQELDAAKALELLPPGTSVSSLYPFLEAVVRDRGRKRRDNQVTKNLLKTENLHLRESLIQARSRMLRITEDRDCPVCHKKIGASVFAAYPNGIIVHYSCFKDKNVCPVTGQRFNTPEAVLAQQMDARP